MDIFKVDLNKKKPNDHSDIYLGMGCFWGAERKFWNLSGLYTTAVGYAGGKTKNPNYESVCTGETGHAEIVRVIYNPNQNSLNDVMKIFWESHDPTQLNRQGNDIGSQYRSIILTTNQSELEVLRISKKKFQIELDKNDLSTIRTEIKLLDTFYLAEDYHQKYLHKNPNGYCGLQGTGVNYCQKKNLPKPNVNITRPPIECTRTQVMKDLSLYAYENIGETNAVIRIA